LGSFSFKTQSFQSKEALQQWALNNDGSFQINAFDQDGWQQDEVFARVGVDINFPFSYSESKRSCIIAIIDTGFDFSNLSTLQHRWKNSNETPNDGLDNDRNGYIDDTSGWNFSQMNGVLSQKSNNFHGTHVLGTFFAKGDSFIGVLANTDIQYIPLVVLGNSNDTGTIDSLIAAIQYAEAAGASICNLSLSTYLDDSRLYDVMRKSSMLFIVAAGNDGEDMDNSELKKYPATYTLNNLISVANLRCDGELNLCSNYGKDTVDIAAPGTDIISTYKNNSYEYMSSTSCAAPFVSGAAALVYSESPKPITSAEIRTIILNSTTKRNSLFGKVKSGGMLNITNALESIQ
jgi:subtilisin family serine protease